MRKGSVGWDITTDTLLSFITVNKYFLKNNIPLFLLQIMILEPVHYISGIIYFIIFFLCDFNLYKQLLAKNFVKFKNLGNISYLHRQRIGKKENQVSVFPIYYIY